MNEKSKRTLSWFLVLAWTVTLLSVGAVSALGVPPPPTIGLVVTDQGTDAGTLYPGTSAVVQKILVEDSDDNSDPVTVTEVEVDNLGNVPAGDIEKIEILDSGDNVKGYSSVSSFPVSVDLTDFTVADDGTDTVKVKFYVASSVSTGGSLQAETTLVQDEGSNTGIQKVVEDGVPEDVSTGAEGDTPGIYRPGEGYWFLSNDLSGDWVDRFRFGYYTDYKPVTGDWSNNGTDTFGVYRPSDGTWFLDVDGDGSWEERFEFGTTSGDVPVVGDWDDDGKDTPGIYRPGEGYWFLSNDLSGDWVDRFVFGTTPGDMPVVGAWGGTNSASLSDLAFDKGNSSGLSMARAFAYPNPVTSVDKVTFTVQGAGIEETKVDVFAASGDKVFSSGYQESNSVTWDLSSESKAPNGVYLYQLAVKGSGETLAGEVQKLLVLR